MKDLFTHSVDNSRGDAKAPSYLTVQQRESKAFRWWYRLASPPIPGNLAPFKEKELFRRGRTGSQIIPALYVLLIISIPASITSTNSLLVLIIIAGLLTLTVATVLNRLGKINTAGCIIVATFTAFPVANIVTTPGGVNMLGLPLFGLLVLPLVCAVSFLPEWWVFIVGLINLIFTFLVLLYFPQTGELSAILTIDFPGIITPIILVQIIVSIVAYLWVHSTAQALRRADRAEEIAKLEHDLALQAEATAQQQQKLEVSIQKIVETHTRVANGDFNARVPLTSDNVLWPISGSLNNLLARVQRLRQYAAELEYVKLELQQTREENRRLARRLGDKPF
ncbi:hypothetical protein EPA93_46160 [Ktedonosporobacter rubrisoli]|uniref:HAMP domain-containing protein n=1 Tax=Ktedonosporobacter rubrisoli TaxID=2509675 RepID=A0A4P6K430_KTERU|nr:hypothetical protein [Ktedonosporobacter rubrisoli]QBD82959.1 hypothetical protein EPA93_46160 [Ktedonosporobacter rubrisoli]